MGLSGPRRQCFTLCKTSHSDTYANSGAWELVSVRIVVQSRFREFKGPWLLSDVDEG